MKVTVFVVSDTTDIWTRSFIGNVSKREYLERNKGIFDDSIKIHRKLVTIKLPDGYGWSEEEIANVRS